LFESKLAKNSKSLRQFGRYWLSFGPSCLFEKLKAPLDHPIVVIEGKCFVGKNRKRAKYVRWKYRL